MKYQFTYRRIGASITLANPFLFFEAALRGAASFFYLKINTTFLSGIFNYIKCTASMMSKRSVAPV